MVLTPEENDPKKVAIIVLAFWTFAGYMGFVSLRSVACFTL